MRALNRSAAEILVTHGISGATDVTGFGLLGHGLEMARASGARLVFQADALPSLPGALDLVGAGVETGGAAHNRRFVYDELTVADGLDPAFVTLAHDPQTAAGCWRQSRNGRSIRSSRISTRRASAWRIGHVETGEGLELS